jgi:hypothetical protein
MMGESDLEEDIDDDDFAGSGAPEDEPEPDVGLGPFDAYADTVLDAEAPIEDRCEALRQAILTLIEERDSGVP